MGLYDTVVYEADCRRCGQPLANFQSKSGPCGFELLLPRQVSNFYALCDHCRTMNYFTVTAREVDVTRDEAADQNADNVRKLYERRTSGKEADTDPKEKA